MDSGDCPKNREPLSTMTAGPSGPAGWLVPGQKVSIMNQKGWDIFTKME